MDEIYSPQTYCRWRSYGNYRLILWAWMMNEMTIMLSVTEMSHNGFYIHAFIYILSVIFIGLPLVYSEICLAQYTNTNVISMWNFFPILRGVGYSTIFLVMLKTIYIMVLATWYLEYTFYAAMDPPPWFSCEDFDDNNTKCMVKRINVSIFQHCLETQILYDVDCGMKTASYCFFEKEVGRNTIGSNPLNCLLYLWKPKIASVIISLILFVFSIKKAKMINVVLKLLVVYVSLVVVILLCVALSTSGAWYASKISFLWSSNEFSTCNKTVAFAFLSVGTGYGVIGYLSRDVSFRSPATMTSICTPLLSVFVTVMLGLVIFSGIKTMSYYHGEEENVIEVGNSTFFEEFASISEILSYFDAMPLWAFVWFSTGFWCLFVVLWILYLYLTDIFIENIAFARKHKNLFCMMLAITISIFSWPFFCSDITGSLTDATEIMQITNNILFSISLYWIYGYKNHNVDIIFMIGIKASYFWKISWLLSPVILISILYSKWFSLIIDEYPDSYQIESLSVTCDLLILLISISIYLTIIIVIAIRELLVYYKQGKIHAVFLPTEDWGPKDPILLRSRKMFVPEIMTREFLYRQVRIHGYSMKKNKLNKKQDKNLTAEVSHETSEWSVLTSN